MIDEGRMQRVFESPPLRQVRRDGVIIDRQADAEREAEYLADFAPPGETRFAIPREDGCTHPEGHLFEFGRNCTWCGEPNTAHTNSVLPLPEVSAEEEQAAREFFSAADAADGVDVQPTTTETTYLAELPTPLVDSSPVSITYGDWEPEQPEPAPGAQLEGRSIRASLVHQPLADSTFTPPSTIHVALHSGEPVDSGYPAGTHESFGYRAPNGDSIQPEAQPHMWERGTPGEPDYECYNGDVYPGGLVPPYRGWRPIYTGDCPPAEDPHFGPYRRRDSEQVSIAYQAPNGDSIEEPDFLVLRTPVAWTLGPREWCYGPEDPSERDWEPIYYFDELPVREERYSGAALGWAIMIALFVGSMLGQFVLARVFGK